MRNNKRSVLLSLIACGAAALAMAALILFGPRLFHLYFAEYRHITAERLSALASVMGICVYSGSVLGLAALAMLIRMLLNIYGDRVFVKQNVALLRMIAWCCFAVSAIAIYGGFTYPPFFFVAAAAAFVGVILRVVKNVMQGAVKLREENDLTI